MPQCRPERTDSARLCDQPPGRVPSRGRPEPGPGQHTAQAAGAKRRTPATSTGRCVSSGHDLPPVARLDHEQFALYAAITPARVLSCQAKHQQADGADGVWPTRAIGDGTWPRGGAPAGPGAGAVPSPYVPAAGTGQARPARASAARRPGTPCRPGRTAAGSYPAAAPAPRSGGVAPRFPRPCPGRSPEEAAVTRTRSSHSDRPVEAAQPIILPQRAALGRATSSCGLRRNRIAALPGG